MDEKGTVRLLESCRELKHEIYRNKGADLSAMLIDLGQRLAAEKGSG